MFELLWEVIFLKDFMVEKAWDTEPGEGLGGCPALRAPLHKARRAQNPLDAGTAWLWQLIITEHLCVPAAFFLVLHSFFQAVF